MDTPASNVTQAIRIIVCLGTFGFVFPNALMESADREAKAASVAKTAEAASKKDG